MKKWLKVALYGLGGLVVLYVAALFIVPAILGKLLAIDEPNGIDEAFFAPIHGREEYVTIRGHDQANPPVLVLHGGPGFGNGPVAGQYQPYEKTYTLIQWDQPGTGRTFRRAGNTIPSNLTVEDVVDDGIAVAELVRQRLKIDKLIVLGHSWGTVVGIGMVTKRPDLFVAYVGTGQATSLAARNGWAYERALRKARDTGDVEAIATLERVGPWPYRNADDYRAMRAMAAKLNHEPPLWAPALFGTLFAPGYSIFDRWSFYRGTTASARHFLGRNMDGPELGVDLPANFTSFEVPIFIFQGEDDANTPAVLAKRYYDLISAPQKVYVPMAGGHGVLLEDPETFIAAMDKYVRPLVPVAR